MAGGPGPTHTQPGWPLHFQRGQAILLRPPHPPKLMFPLGICVLLPGKRRTGVTPNCCSSPARSRAAPLRSPRRPQTLPLSPGREANPRPSGRDASRRRALPAPLPAPAATRGAAPAHAAHWPGRVTWPCHAARAGWVAAAAADSLAVAGWGAVRSGPARLRCARLGCARLRSRRGRCRRPVR